MARLGCNCLFGWDGGGRTAEAEEQFHVSALFSLNFSAVLILDFRHWLYLSHT